MEVAELRQHVVAFDVRDPERHPRRGGQLAHCAGQAWGIEPTGVRDHLDAPLGDRRQVWAQLPEEVRDVARPSAPLAHREGGEGDLREEVAHHDVDRVTRHHLVERREPISEVAGEVADPHRSRSHASTVERTSSRWPRPMSSSA
jgi:hypothetical protein